jgi:hypothetical protein
MPDQTTTKARSKFLGQIAKSVPSAPLPMRMTLTELNALFVDMRAAVKTGRGPGVKGDDGIDVEFVFLPGDGNGRADAIQIVATYGG